MYASANTGPAAGATRVTPDASERALVKGTEIIQLLEQLRRKRSVCTA